jgi:hypothetical protein
MTSTNHLALYDAANAALSKAVRVDEVKKIRDEAQALKLCAKIAKDRDLEANAAVLRARAERRLGEMIKAQKETVGLAKAGRRPKNRVSEKPDLPTLEEAGIDKNLAHRARSAAAMSEQDFEEGVNELRDDILSGDCWRKVPQVNYPETPEQEAERKAEERAARAATKKRLAEQRQKWAAERATAEPEPKIEIKAPEHDPDDPEVKYTEAVWAFEHLQNTAYRLQMVGPETIAAVLADMSDEDQEDVRKYLLIICDVIEQVWGIEKDDSNQESE